MNVCMVVPMWSSGVGLQGPREHRDLGSLAKGVKGLGLQEVV